MSQDDELERLREQVRARRLLVAADDVARTANLPSAEQMLARAKAAELRDTSSEPAAVRRRWRYSPQLVAVAAGAAVVLGLVFALPGTRDTAAADTPPVLKYEFVKTGQIAFAPGRPAGAQLRKLARAAEAAGESPGTGPTQYVRSTNWFAQLSDSDEESDAALVPKIRESWLRADGSRVFREFSGKPLAPDGRQRDVKVSVGGKAVIERLPNSGKGADFVDLLGDDPAQVRANLLKSRECPAKSGPVAAECLMSEIGSLTAEHVVSGRMFAMFWQVLADEPSIRDLGSAEDRVHRPGVGISMISPTAPQFRRVLIISPRSGRLLGSEEVLIKSDKALDLHAPAIYSFTAITQSRRTASTGPRQ